MHLALGAGRIVDCTRVRGGGGCLPCVVLCCRSLRFSGCVSWLCRSLVGCCAMCVTFGGAAWCVWLERLGGAVQHAWPSGRLGLEIRVGSWLGMGRPFMLTMCVMVSHGDASHVAFSAVVGCVLCWKGGGSLHCWSVLCGSWP